MKIRKSSRHQKIIGDFGELLISNWLSRSGFEVALVDHTGLDIIAYNPATKERLGITVKSRTRNVGKEKTTVRIFTHKKEENERRNLMEACKSFSCEPWIGVYVETENSANVFLTSLERFDKKYFRQSGKPSYDWSMSGKAQNLYAKDRDIMHIKIEFEELNWWKD